METLPDELLLCGLKTIFDIDVSKSELNTPNCTFVCKMYSFFLRDFGMNISVLSQIPMEAPSNVHENPDFYSITIYQIKLAKLIGWLLNSLKAKMNFSLQDIIRPEPIRTKKFLSQFLKFYEFLNNNIHLVSEIEEEVEKKSLDFNTLKEKIEIFKNEINRKGIKNAEHEVEIKRINEEKVPFEENILEQKDISERQKGRLNGIKEEILTSKLSIDDSNQKLLQRQHELDCLATQVCFENEMMEYEQMKEDAVDQKNKNEELDKTLKKTQLLIEQHQQDFDSLTSLMNGPLLQIEKETEKKLSLDERIKDANKERTLLKEERANIEAKIEELSNTIISNKAEVASLQQSKQTTTQFFMEERELEIKTLNLLKKNYSKEEEETKMLEKDTKRAKNMIEKEKGRFDKYMTDFESCLMQLDEKINADFRI